jgi:hypothetical protein
MEKLVYVLWNPQGASGEQFKDEMLGKVANDLVEAGARRIAINLVDEAVSNSSTMRLTRLDPPPAGMMSFWLEVSDDRGSCEEAVERATSRLAGYLVLESVPIVNTTETAALGARTPGINMVALLERPERLTHQAWLEHWFGHHRKVAVETQCTFAYVRNEVVRALTEDAPPWEAIVEEGFPIEAVTDPMLWYCADGSKEKMEKNLARMMESVQAFLDIDRVESHPMSQYRITA